MSLELTNNRVEREIRKLVLGRRNWLFTWEDLGGQRTACILTIVGTCVAHHGQSAPIPSSRHQAPHQRMADLQIKRPPAGPDSPYPFDEHRRDERGDLGYMIAHDATGRVGEADRAVG